MIDILIFVEDDGAANLIRGLAPVWDQRGQRVVVVAQGPAVAKLVYLGEEFVQLTPDVSATHVLDRYQPRLLAVGTAENRDTLALALVAEARARGIPTVGFIDAYANAAWRWRGRSDEALRYAPDWLVVNDEATRAAYQRLGVPEANVAVIGYRQADYVEKTRLELERRGRATVRREVLPSGAGERPVVVFVAEQFGGLDPQQSYRSKIFSALEGLLGVVATLSPRPYVVVRLHPKNKLDDMAAFRDRIDFISHGGDGLPIVYSGDMVVGSTSTLLFEAALMGQPTCAFLQDREAHDHLPSIMAGVTRVVTIPAQLRVALLDVLTGRWVSRVPALAEPGADQRLVDFLLSRLSL